MLRFPSERSRLRETTDPRGCNVGAHAASTAFGMTRLQLISIVGGCCLLLSLGRASSLALSSTGGATGDFFCVAPRDSSIRGPWTSPLARAARSCAGRQSFRLFASRGDDDESTIAMEGRSTGRTETAARSEPDAAELTTAHGEGLTKQQRILLELGIEPETEDERRASAAANAEAERKLRNEKRINVAVAVLSFLAAITNYVWQLSHPVTAVGILAEMQSDSAPITVVGRNGKPTVVDFWAPWCENCRAAAPTLRAIEREYAGRVNFVMVNADDGSSWGLIDRFNVDAIPHMAMVGSDGYVETALIGPIPRSVLRADLDAMISNANADVVAWGRTGAAGSAEEGKEKEELPYKMFDAFQNRPETERTITFE